MFHVLDHNDVVYSGELSQSTEYILEHYGRKFDDAMRSGIRILYTDPLRSLNEAKKSVLGNSSPDFWKPVEDWRID